MYQYIEINVFKLKGSLFKGTTVIYIRGLLFHHATLINLLAHLLIYATCPSGILKLVGRGYLRSNSTESLNIRYPILMLAPFGFISYQPEKVRMLLI